MRSCVVLLSGGLDSATTLAIATKQAYACYALSFVYGQRHEAEIKAAGRVARRFHVREHRLFKMDLGQLGGSALTDRAIPVPLAQAGEPGARERRDHEDISVTHVPAREHCDHENTPATYMPARNTVFLSVALTWAEVLGVRDIFIGVNAVDYSGYPDCRPTYIKAFGDMANLATRAAVEGQKTVIHTPLIELSKAEIIRRGVALGVDYGLTVSCYQADEDGRACGRCASCVLRRQGFAEAGVADCTRYQGSEA